MQWAALCDAPVLHSMLSDWFFYFGGRWCTFIVFLLFVANDYVTRHNINTGLCWSEARPGFVKFNCVSSYCVDRFRTHWFSLSIIAFHCQQWIQATKPKCDQFVSISHRISIKQHQHLAGMDILTPECAAQSIGPANQLFGLLVQTILAAQCAISPKDMWPKDYGPTAVEQGNGDRNE